MKALSILTIFIFCLGLSPGVIGHPGRDTVLEYLSDRIIIQPGNQDLYRQRGQIYTHDGQFDQALADLQHAETLGDPRVVAFDLGMVYFQTARYDEALVSFNSYLAYLPGHVKTLRYRSRLLLKTGDIDAAISDCTALLSNTTGVTPTDYLSVAELMLQSTRYDINDAIAVLDKGLDLMGPIPQLQNRAIELELTRGSPDKAISRLRSQASQLSGSPFWQLSMGRLLLTIGKTSLAHEHFTLAGQQLAVLRKTPARMQLLNELQMLLKPTAVTADLSGIKVNQPN